jgi:hypothetical protein
MVSAQNRWHTYVPDDSAAIVAPSASKHRSDAQPERKRRKVEKEPPVPAKRRTLSAAHHKEGVERDGSDVVSVTICNIRGGDFRTPSELVERTGP